MYGPELNSHDKKYWIIWDKIIVCSVKWIWAWTKDTYSALRSCPGQYFESTYPLSLPLSHTNLYLTFPFSLLHSISNPALPKISTVILGETSEPGVQIKFLPNIMSGILIPQPSHKQWSRKKSSVGIYLHSKTGHPPHTLPIVSTSPWCADHLMCTSVYVIKNLIKGSIHIHTPSCDGSRKSPTLKQNTPGRSGILDLLVRWTYELEVLGFRKWSMCLFMSHRIVIQIPVWTLLTNGLADNISKSYISVNRTSLYLGNSLQTLDPRFSFKREGTLDNPQLKVLPQCSNKIRRDILIPFLYNWHNRKYCTGPSHQ